MLLPGLLAQAQLHPGASFFMLLPGLLAQARWLAWCCCSSGPGGAAGFALAALPVELVGPGTCGYNLSHLHVN